MALPADPSPFAAARAGSYRQAARGPISADVWAWFVRLRWGACIGQALAILLVRFIFCVPIASLPLLLLVALLAASNVALGRRLRAAPAPEARALALVIVADILEVTGLLGLTGGPANPFACIYTVHVALAATVLPPVAVLSVMGAALAGFSSLFCWHTVLPATQVVLGSTLYLEGLVAAFVVAMGFIAYFVGRIQGALQRSERRLAEAKERAARDEKLSSLATLAAGAAHELATPLATIAVAAKEMQRRLAMATAGPAGAAQILPGGQALGPALGEDAQLIRREVERCREVLDHMAFDGGASQAEPLLQLTPQALSQHALGELERAGRLQLTVDPLATGPLILPQRSVAHSLRAVVHNALEAQAERPRSAPQAPASLPVRVRVSEVEGSCYFTVDDQGPGMDAAALARVGEPFFTTKGPGRGMGMGLFLARTVAERLGGSLDVRSRQGQGTTVVLRLPVAARTKPTGAHPGATAP